MPGSGKNISQKFNNGPPQVKHTRRLFSKLKSDLAKRHDPVDVRFIIYLIHGEAVSVLDRSVAEGKAYDLSELHSMN